MELTGRMETEGKPIQSREMTAALNGAVVSFCRVRQTENTMCKEDSEKT